MQKLHELFRDDPSPKKTAASLQQAPKKSSTAPIKLTEAEKEQLLREMGEAETDDKTFQNKQAKTLRELAIQRLRYAEKGTAAGVEEGNRIKGLSLKEQQQIIEDYKLALQFASEETEETKDKSYKL